MRHATYFAISLLALIPSVVLAQDRLITTVPEESDEILANPGVGWETFHHTSKQDRTLPPWIPSTVQYIRWGWGQLEPQAGKIDEGLLDRVLKEAHDSGQKLAFRVMTCSTTVAEPYHPDWLKTVGGKIINARYEILSFPIPDMDDPVVLERHLDFIKRLGERYDGHPDIDHVDLGSIGWWGEWHLSGSDSNKMPTAENQQKIIDAYLAAFKKTPLLMLIGGGERLAYATKHGTGWRADCLGDLGGFGKNWCHMKKGYPVWFQESHLENVWETAPVAWETCWDMRKWVSEGWSLRYIFNYALACHASYINNKSAPLPQGDNVRPELERFLRRLGYRLVLEEIKHPAQIRPGDKLSLETTWRNTGSAPCYKPYRLAYRLSAPDKPTTAIITETTVSHWMPGSVEMFTESFLKEPPDLPPGDPRRVKTEYFVPLDLPAGDYKVAVAVVDGDTGRPVVRLGIKGRDDDGWYPVSAIRVAH